MKQYTKEEFDSIYNSAKIDFENLSKELLKRFTECLNTIQNESCEPVKKLQKAFYEKEASENELRTFIYTKYPKTDDLIVNSIVIYTIETAVFIYLLSDDFNKSRKEFETLYQDFVVKNFPG
ncbi:hypothetical protein [Flavobacterium covae]